MRKQNAVHVHGRKKDVLGVVRSKNYAGVTPRLSRTGKLNRFGVSSPEVG
jgi:hypothetical protein